MLILLRLQIVTSAIYAAWAHRHQRRKVSGEAYIWHPYRVAKNVAYLNDPEVTAAAWLHDVLEDTDCKISWYKEYDIAFSARTVWLVEQCTEIKYRENGEKIPWLERKQTLLEHARKDPAVAAIKVADLTDNLEDSARNGWGSISVSREDYAIYARGLLKLADGDNGAATRLRKACASAGVTL